MHSLHRDFRRILLAVTMWAVSMAASASFAQTTSPIETLKQRDAALRALDGSASVAEGDSLVRLPSYPASTSNGTAAFHSEGTA